MVAPAINRRSFLDTAPVANEEFFDGPRWSLKLKGEVGEIVCHAWLRTHVFDFDKPDPARELTKRLNDRDVRRIKNPSRVVYEPEEM